MGSGIMDLRMRIALLLLAFLDAVESCASWCNVYTCSLDACGGCSICDHLHDGKYCARWCNEFTSGASFCKGCSAPQPTCPSTAGIHRSISEGVMMCNHQ